MRTRVRNWFWLLWLAAALSAPAEPRDLAPALETVRAKYHLPACASAVVEGDKIVAIGATGVRRADETVPVTTEDVWHTGSCTKSMTAVLIGVLVDEGKLQWEMPIPEALPGVPCHPGWRKVTVWEVVTHRSGVTAGQPRESRSGSPQEQRALFAKALLARAPLAAPGHFDYSNAGYGLLGAIIERASGRSYEEMLRQHLFTPLGLKTAGFGAPATPGKTDQPWGHWRHNDRMTPVDPIPANQFPPALAPAACVHLSLKDFARYAIWLATNEPQLVKPKTFAFLQTPPAGSTYAGGLWKSMLPGVGGEAVCHTGHLGGFFAVFYAGRERGCVTVFNTEGGGWEWLGDVLSEAALKAAR